MTRSDNMEHVEVLRKAIAELRQDNIPTLRRATAVQRAESAIAALSAPPSAPVGVDLVAELKALRQAYVRLLETGRDRICDLGGECDPVDVMERDDIDLRRTDAALRALAQQPAAVDELPDCPHSALDGCDCYATQHQEPTT